MTRFRAAVLLVFCLLGITTRAELPRLSVERVVLRTVAGDIVLALYPDVAPQTVAQILKLMRLGVYDTTHFFRVERNFVMQVSVAADRLMPLTPEQSSALRKLPLEVKPDVKHHVWTLSMARMPDDPNSAESSFSILLGDAPHLDGQYTVFGHVERGFEVVGELAKVTRDSNHRPLTRLTIEKAEVIDSVTNLGAVALAGPKPVADPATTPDGLGQALRGAMAGGLVLIALLSAVAFALGGRLARPQANAFHLLTLLVAAFLLAVLLAPAAKTTPLVGGGVFLLWIGLFKLLGRFESA